MNFVESGPGSPLPDWLQDLDHEAFPEAWTRVGEREWDLQAPDRGHALWSVQPSLGEAELLRVAVRPEARRSGLGRALLRESQARLEARGIRTLLLEVRVSNAPARALYEAEGWRGEGLRRGYYRDGEDAALYRKELG